MRILTRAVVIPATLTGLLLGGAGPVLADGQPSPAAPASTAAATPLGAASAKARVSGGPVTVDELTTETADTVANADGTFTLTTHLQPVRVKQDGRWKPLDASLARNGDGTFSPKTAPAGLALSGGGTGPLATLTDPKGRRLALTFPAGLPAPEVSGDSARYDGVLPGVDLHVTATEQGGLREVLVVHDAIAAANPALRSLQLATHTTDGLSLTTGRDGSLTAGDGDGTAAFTAPTPVMWDSAGRATGSPTQAPAEHQPGGGAQVAPIGVEATPDALVLTPDAKLLTGQNTVWPLYIDPAVSPVTSTTNHYTIVQEGCPGYTYYDVAQDNGQGIGYQHWKDCYGLQRSFYEVGLGNLSADMVISKSVLHLTETYGASWDCTNKAQVRLATVGRISSSTSWDNQPSVTGDGWLGTQYPTSANGGGNCGNQEANFDVTGQIRKLAGHADTWTFGLYGNESKSDDNNDYMRFNRNPYLVTVFDIAPNQPDALATTPAAHNPDGNGCDARPGWIGNSGTAGSASDIALGARLSTRMSGVNLRARFKVWDTQAGGAAKSQPTSDWVSGGGTVRTNLGFTVSDGHQYSWSVQAEDSTLTGPVSPTCSFMVDLTPPTVPAIADSPVFPPLGGSAAPTGHAGDSGVSVKVTATDPTPGGCQGTCLSSGVKRFEYALDTDINGSLWVPATPNGGGSATADVPIVLSAAQWGTHTLYVRAVDAAGNTQATTAQYSFFAPWNPAAKVTQGDLDGDGVPDLAAPTTDGDLVLVRGDSNPAAAPQVISTKDKSPDGTGWNNYLIAHRGTATGSNTDDLFAFDKATHQLYLYPNDATTAGGTAGRFTLTQNVIPIKNSGSCPAGGSDGTWNNVSQLLAPGKLAQLADAPDLITVDRGELRYYPGSFQAGCNLAAGVRIGTGDWSDTTLLAPGKVGGVPTLWARDNMTGAVLSYPLTFANGTPTASFPAPARAALVSAVLDGAGKNLCLDIDYAKTANGTAAQVWACNGTNAQTLTRGADNTLHVLGKCLDVSGGRTDNLTPVQLWTCNNTAAQQWVPGPNPGSLKNPASGRCLADPSANKAPGTRLVIQDCAASAGQNWAATTAGNALAAAQPVLPLGLGGTDFPTAGSPGDAQGTGNPAIYATTTSGQIIEYPGATPAGATAQFGSPLTVGYLHQPVDWWKLADTTDSIRPANGLTLNGGAATTTDPAQGGALALNGSSAYAATAGPVLNTGAGYTVSAWVNLSDLKNNSTFVSQSGTSANGLQLYYSNWAHAFAIGHAHADDTAGAFSSAYGPADGPLSPKVNTWYHLVGVYDADRQQLRLYVNGQAAGTADYAGTVWNATGPLQLGRRLYQGGYGEYAAGRISDVQVFDQALSPAGVASLGKSQPVPTQLA
ncbi:LamG-like jellyroll fold domain-containing protein [Kitasatospora aureofaciens]|uniref:LamG-like jellyroll fold domain-containing protein n=1 Tax=Kitasatospora aureofaciens TaxID=1894 RepID=UPI001C45D82B|nr:LamG-like jellyroll fold domain-containing protein [Kitasatospora aureofaciens]MBV6696614.1 ricin-type beta-trefoil lectin domain protein [Kitasatospora aureofaciens]